jgi:hypothetical protein
MTLRVIGSGVGRTGTMSLKHALEQLGFGPCHHMVEVFAHPDSVPLWMEAGAGKADWDAIFGAYDAIVDYPGALFWRELIAHYPDAKVILSLRDPDRWFESTQETIFAARSPGMMPPAPFKPFFDMIYEKIGVDLHDRDAMVAYFKRHNEDVTRTVPPERLLVFEAKQGWEPLCAFLGVPVPDTPYPSENSREEFKARAKGFAGRS